MDLLKHKKTLYKVQALERALNILDCFTFQKREMSLSEVVQQTGLNKTTAKRLIANLTARGYLQQDPKSKHYQLGLRLFELGGIVFSSFSLRKAAAYPMSHLQNSTGATVLLGVIMEDQLVYMDKRDGKGMIRISSDIGWRRPLHYGMLGMVLMAYLSEEEVRDILKKCPLVAHTPYSITDECVFRHRLEKIRRDGYVAEREEAVEGIVGIAAPIRDYSRQVVAALGVALPVGQLNAEEEVQKIVDLIKKTTDSISSDLGYRKI
jgi:IclR family KDG regulon transcriptional repressor